MCVALCSKRDRSVSQGTSINSLSVDKRQDNRGKEGKERMGTWITRAEHEHTVCCFTYLIRFPVKTKRLQYAKFKINSNMIYSKHAFECLQRSAMLRANNQIKQF